MLVKVDEESLEKALVKTLENSIKGLEEDLAKNDRTKQGSGTFSYDYDEDCEKLFEMKEAMRLTLSWYKEV